MPPIQYKVYKNDAEKGKRYNHRLSTAQVRYEEYENAAIKWWDRYENVPTVRQTTVKGHRVNVTSGTSIIDALFSGLTAVEVEFLLKEMGAATHDQAELAQVALNEEWRRLAIDAERDAAIKDALIVGIGFVKVGYDFLAEETLVARDLVDVQNEVSRLIAEGVKAGYGAPDQATIERLVPTTEPGEAVLRDRVVVDYVPWQDIRWDPTAKRWKDVRWVAQLTKMTVDEVRDHPVWHEYLAKRRGLQKLDRLKADSTIDKQLLITSKAQGDDERLTVVEYHDLETGTICTFVKGQDWLLNESVNPFALFPDYEDRSAFVPCVLRATNRRVRGISEMEVMYETLREKDLYRTETAEYTDRFKPKLIGPEDGLTEEGKAALANSQQGAYVSTDRSVDPASIKVMDPPSLPSEVFQMDERLENELREATGVNELMRGLFPEQHRATATETQAVVSQGQARQSEKRNKLEQFHNDIARRILTLMQQFYSQARMVRMSDPAFGNTEWSWSGDDILGEFDLHAQLAPREAETRDSRREQALQEANIIGPFTEAGPNGEPPVIDKAVFVTYILKKYGMSKRDITELVNNEADQQVAAQKQNQQVAAQATAAGGVADPNLVPGPLSGAELEAATNAEPVQAGVYGPVAPA